MICIVERYAVLQGKHGCGAPICLEHRWGFLSPPASLGKRIDKFVNPNDEEGLLSAIYSCRRCGSRVPETVNK
jgi:hypothetical protein